MTRPAAAAARRAALIRQLRAGRSLYQLWSLEDESGQSLLKIADGRAAMVATGDLESCSRLRGSAVDIDAFLDGSLGLDRGMVTGRLATDHLGRARSLADCVAACRPGAEPAMPASVQRAPGRFAVGKRYRGGSTVVEPDDAAAYAAATDDPSIAYLGADAIVSPMFHARLFRDELFALMQDDDVQPDFARVLHVGHHATFSGSLRPWDVVQRRARLDHVAQKGGGLLISGTLTGLVAGAPVVQARTVFFVPGQRVAEPGTFAGPVPPAPAPAPVGPPARTIDWQMSPDQSARYADASLDDNPLHIDVAAAHAAGHTGLVVHGLCTLARSVQGVLAALAYADPRGVRRLGGRFAAPVFNGDRLQTRVWVVPGGFAFDVHNSAGAAVLTHGVVEIAP